MSEQFEPKGYTFFSKTYNKEMRLVIEGGWKDWIVYRHPDGQWVSLRKATVSDWEELAAAMSLTVHEKEPTK